MEVEKYQGEHKIGDTTVETARQLYKDGWRFNDDRLENVRAPILTQRLTGMKQFKDQQGNIYTNRDDLIAPFLGMKEVSKDNQDQSTVDYLLAMTVEPETYSGVNTQNSQTPPNFLTDEYCDPWGYASCVAANIEANSSIEMVINDESPLRQALIMELRSCESPSVAGLKLISAHSSSERQYQAARQSRTFVALNDMMKSLEISHDEELGEIIISLVMKYSDGLDWMPRDGKRILERRNWGRFLGQYKSAQPEKFEELQEQYLNAKKKLSEPDRIFLGENNIKKVADQKFPNRKYDAGEKKLYDLWIGNREGDS